MDQRIPQVRAWFERIYVGGIPQLIRDETAFLSFVCMLTAVEALAGYSGPDASGAGANGDRFRRFIEGYFDAEYHELAGDLWAFRNGMVHGFSPRQFALTHHQSRLHLSRMGDGTVLLNAEDFYAASSRAARSYFTAVWASPVLQEAFLRRLDSPSGGSFAVGLVEVVTDEPV